ncbi:DhNV_045 [Dikerogammarus haemobaphes nudivirus]|nr:DhNV_045 [Dikerogammarus haemobaphes nudivirus]
MGFQLSDKLILPRFLKKYIRRNTGYMASVLALVGEKMWRLTARIWCHFYDVKLPIIHKVVVTPEIQATMDSIKGVSAANYLETITTEYIESKDSMAPIEFSCDLIMPEKSTATTNDVINADNLTEDEKWEDIFKNIGQDIEDETNRVLYGQDIIEDETNRVLYRQYLQDETDRVLYRQYLEATVRYYTYSAQLAKHFSQSKSTKYVLVSKTTKINDLVSAIETCNSCNKQMYIRNIHMLSCQHKYCYACIEVIEYCKDCPTVPALGVDFNPDGEKLLIR